MAKQSLLISRSAGRRLQKQVRDYDRLLRNTCEALAAEAAAGRDLSAAAAWLLDNYLFVHAQAQEVRLAMPPNFLCRLPRASADQASDRPRVAAVADAIVDASNGTVTAETIRTYLKSYQQSTPLALAELWALEAILKLTLIRRMCHWVAAGLTDSPESEAAIRNGVSSLRKMESLQWREVVESVSIADRILRGDPAGVYSRMDFTTRDRYRRQVEQLARGSWYREERVAEIAIELAREEAARKGEWSREAHVGYFLIGPGTHRLKSRLEYRCTAGEAIREAIRSHPNLAYLGVIAGVTALLLLTAGQVLRPMPWWFALLLLVPASQAAMSIVNRLISMIIPPERLPRMDFSDGIPPACRTFVVVPTLLLSRAEVMKLLERLEIHYLAGRDPNLLFALLTDFPDGETAEGNPDLLKACVDGIRILNRRYAQGDRGPFYLFHRSMEWNPSEGVWMGHERKRGKLNDFNALLRGTKDAFTTKVGDMTVLPTVRYVLTLDSDTQLPRDTAQELVATIAHPLNRAVVDEASGMVREGYAILQPRVTISMESASRSRLAQIYGGKPGFDPYATAISDVYQDLHGHANFTGKGIYDVAAFERVMQDRFPENALLSHDLIEGEHARVGLVTDLEVVDDYPSTYESYSKRKHRWVRGDWQIVAWLLPRVPDAAWRWIPNPLSLLSRWKIFDNLRRSLVEIVLLAAAFAGWIALPAGCARVTAVVIGLFLLPTYSELLFSFFRLPPVRFWKTYFREVLFRFGQGHAEAAFSLAFLACQACLMADAILRTMIRLLVTRHHLLEWETMAQSEERAQQGRSLVRLYLLLCPVLALAAITGLAIFGAHVDRVTRALLALWAVTPLAVIWVNGRSARATRWLKNDVDFLRGVCLRTWRYFADYQVAEDHWLAPDHVQEQPPAVAHRTSPTNLGLQLTANLAAHDLGYLNFQEVSTRLHDVLESMRGLERFRGHFYNWYDTQTREVLPPRYVSTVDSGNLAASLVTLKQGCLGLRDRPLAGAHTLLGLRDHVLLFRDTLPPEAHTGSIMRVLASLLKQLAYVPTDLFFWEGVLTDVQNLTERLQQPLDWICSHLASKGAEGLADVRYWHEALRARARLALEELRTLAPWLAGPFETELRMCSRDGSMAEIMEELCRVPRLRDLPAQYQAIGQAIARRLVDPAPLPESTRRVLLDLLPELERAKEIAHGLIGEFEREAALASRWVEEMDFAFLFNPRRKLLHLGSNVDTGLIDESHYDLLASEARTGVFLAIAKGDIPRDAWFRLQRKLVGYQGHRTMVSWSGTMFEYLMPALFMKTYDHTLLGESLTGAVRVQQRYGKERNVPWGISEAACATRDHSLGYQYRAFGVPPLATDPQSGERLVIAPYATMLATMVDRPGAARNLREMAGYDWMGRYGFYESVDYSRRPELVRMYMVHHQGMGLLALCNALLDAPMQERFHADPMVVATEFLLQERLPSLIEVGEEDERLHPEPAPSPVAVPAGVLAEAALPPPETDVAGTAC